MREYITMATRGGAAGEDEPDHSYRGRPRDPLSPPAPPTADAARPHAVQDATQRALHVVPADQRTCLVLNMYQGLYYKEIAETLGISVNLVAVRIFRGREKFIEAYKKANPVE